MVPSEPHAVGHSSPAPIIFDEFPVNPFVMTFEAEGKKNVARSFWLAIGKTAPTLDFLPRRGRGRGADDSHKTLTQRADYSSMTIEISPKIRPTKQRTK
jgi:hypothetical protein